MLSSLEACATLTFWPSRETKISLMRQKVDKYTTDKCLFDCDNKVTKGGEDEQQTKITMMKVRQKEAKYIIYNIKCAIEGETKRQSPEIAAE